MERLATFGRGLARLALLAVLRWLSGPSRSLAKRQLRPPPALFLQVEVICIKAQHRCWLFCLTDLLQDYLIAAHPP